MSFMVYDLIFLAIFCILVGTFLFLKRKKLKVESKIILLYKTKWGIKTINAFSKKFSKFLDFMAPISITYGFIAMLAGILLLIQSAILMINAVSVIKAPPLMPLVPYMPQMFDLPLPPFYFTTWLIVIAIIAIVHEFGHGVYASRYNIPIKATGFGFLGPFLAAFVEPDEKIMSKKSKKKQMTIISAGSFSNFLFAIFFLLLLQLFFFAVYSPAGITNYMYSLERVNVSTIEGVGPYTFNEFISMNDSEINTFVDGYNLLIFTDDPNKNYLLNQDLLPQIESIKQNKTDLITLYNDAPAIRANLSGAIQYIDDIKINEVKDITFALQDKKVGEEVIVKTTVADYTIILENYPEIYLSQNDSIKEKGFLGIGFPKLSGIQMFFSSISSPYFSPFNYVEERIPNSRNILIFFTDIFFWLILILISVSIMNMLPLGILDGGKFTYLAFLALTKSKKKAIKAYSISSWIIGLLFLLLMVIWFLKL